MGDEHDVSHLTYVLPFPDGRFLISFGEKYELRHQKNAEKVLSHGRVSIAKHHNWSTDIAGKKLYVQNEKGLSRYNINSGEQMKPIELSIPIPRTNFPDSKSTDMWPSFYASLWQCPGGPFVHVTDGPRGWREDVGTSPDGRYSLVPCTKGAAILSLEGKEPKIKSKMQFYGRLRAFAFVENEVYAINHLGTLFVGTI